MPIGFGKKNSIKMASTILATEQKGANDVENQVPVEPSGQYQRHGRLVSMLKVDDGEVYGEHPEKHSKWYQRIIDFGIEENGIKPVPIEKRTDKRYHSLFTVIFTALMCLLP